MTIVFPYVEQIVFFFLEEFGSRADAMGAAQEPLECAGDRFGVLARIGAHHQIRV